MVSSRQQSKKGNTATPIAPKRNTKDDSSVIEQTKSPATLPTNDTVYDTLINRIETIEVSTSQFATTQLKLVEALEAIQVRLETLSTPLPSSQNPAKKEKSLSTVPPNDNNPFGVLTDIDEEDEEFNDTTPPIPSRYSSTRS